MSYVELTIRALELASRADISAVQLADALAIDVRTARRLLNRLADAGVLAISRPVRPRYVAGPRLHALAEALQPVE